MIRNVLCIVLETNQGFISAPPGHLNYLEKNFKQGSSIRLKYLASRFTWYTIENRQILKKMKTTNLKSFKTKISALIFCLLLLAIPAWPQFELVKEINSLSGQSGGPHGFIQRSETLYFIANDGEHGQELWRTNGTGIGTYMVKDINPGNATGITTGTRMVVFNNKLYFLADDGIHGKELWYSDATYTLIVEDLRPGENTNHIFYLTVVNNLLLFQASPIIGDLEWWRVNLGNTTEIVKDIRPGNLGAQLRSPSVGLDLIFFGADDGGVQGEQLWITNGTEAGTFPIADMRVGIGQGVEYNGHVYLMLEGNGTDGFELHRASKFGDVNMVRNINPVEFGGSQPKAVDFHGMVYNGYLYFNANEPTHGDALWKTDGTQNGTTLVKDIYPGSATDKGYIGVMQVFNNFLYFTADDGTPGLDLWRTDGTENGTIKIKDFGGGISQQFYELEGKLYFRANDGLHGYELWESDGSGEGTKMVNDFSPGISHGIGEITVFENKLFLSANGASGYELYSYTPIDCDALQITMHPAGDTIEVGESITLSVVVTGSVQTYQWQKNNIDILGANSATYTIDDAAIEDSGEYRCQVTNECSTVMSNIAILVVVEDDPVLGAEEFNNNNVVSLYPNPANQWVHISLNAIDSNQSSNVSIFNMQGLLVLEETFNLNPDMVNVAKLPPGIYQVVIQSPSSMIKTSRFSIWR